ncbi:MAG: ATP synthase F0 subunit C [Elusimicrobia bacterium]|nr:ATP synthase F0 subunit C [Elusimicrobiota bacterium]
MSTAHGLIGLAAGFGAGIILLGAAFGISKLTAAGLEGTARQPEASENLWRAIIVPAALLEGLGIIALGVCYFLAFIAFQAG